MDYRSAFVHDATHLPALVRAVHKLGGPVLEIGAGWNSTPVLHAMDIGVMTLESDPDWAAAFEAMPLRSGNRIIYSATMVDEMWHLSSIPWKIVFIDAHMEFRIPATEIFAHVPLIVAHDTEAAYWAPAWPNFKSIKHWNWRTPWVSYLSNAMDVTTI